MADERRREPPGPFGWDNPAPANDSLDGPPGPDEGEILSVDFDRTDRLFRVRECQQCGEGFDASEPYVYVWGWNWDALGRCYFRVRICSRECWTAWASANDG